MIQIENAAKSFTLHNQGGAVIPVMQGASLHVDPGVNRPSLDRVGLGVAVQVGRGQLVEGHAQSLPGPALIIFTRLSWATGPAPAPAV